MDNTIDIDQVKQALFAASRLGNVPVLREIFGILDDLNIHDERGYTPLILAVYNAQLEAAEALIDAGVDLNVGDNHGNNALMGACFKGHTEIAKLLIDRGAQVDALHGNNGTALMFAAMFARTEIIDLLLANGADKNLRDSRGLTAYDHAVQQGNSEAAEKLQ